MNIAIVYSHKSKYAQQLATMMAKTARTQAISFQDYDFDACVDLLVLGFDCPYFDDISDLCMRQDLPLMREQYCCKLPIELKCQLSDNAINGGIVYVNDMINICRDYY